MRQCDLESRTSLAYVLSLKRAPGSEEVNCLSNKRISD